MRLAILGLGLIGGSIARDLASVEGWRITAWSPRPATLAAARRRGLIAETAPDPEAAVAGAELVLLAAPPLANLELVGRVGPLVAAARATLTDVTSSQGRMAEAAARVPGLRFVGGHPMSGRDAAGLEAAEAGLFAGRPWVVLPSPAAGASDVARVRALAEACGARVVQLDPASHDLAVAAISHLPLLGSLALVEAVTAAPDWPLAAQLAAQGWRDATRLARGDPGLALGILVTNSAAVAERLRAYRAALDAWQERLDGLASGSVTPEAVTALRRELEALASRAREAAPPGGTA